MDEYKEISIQCCCLIDMLKHIMDTQYFVSLPSYEKKKKSLETIILFVELSRDVVLILCKNAKRYDINQNIKANGFRSIIKVFEKSINALLICSSKIKFDIPKLIFSSKDSLKNLIYWKKFLSFFYPIYCVCLKILERQNMESSPTCFLNKDHELNILTKNLSIFLHKSFYGSNLGFQYSSKIHKLLNLLATMMVSYSSGFDHSSIKLVQSAIAFTKNGYYHLKPKLRCRKLLSLYTSPSIEFCKGFWSLLDDYGLQYIPTLIGPSLGVNNAFVLNTKTLCIPHRSGDTPVILFSAAYPSLKYLPKHINARLLSLKLYQGFISNTNIHLYPIFNTPKSNSSSLIIHIHGGGFISRTTKSSEIYLRTWAETINVPIFSIDYSLSPNASFPVAIEECFYAYAWALTNCHSLGWSGEKVVFVGDSAGANLVLAVVHKAIETGIRIPDGIVCLYPCTNMTYNISPSRLLSTIDILLGPGFLKACISAYIPNHLEDFVSISPHAHSSSTIASKKRSIANDVKLGASTSMEIFNSLPIDPRAKQFYEFTTTCNSNIKSALSDSLMFDTDVEEILNNNESICFSSLASPLFTSPEILQYYPPTKLILADMDPLLDDGIEFARLLISHNKNVDIKIMEDLPHGFLELGNFIPETKVANQVVMKCIQDSFSSVWCQPEIV